MKKLKKNVIQGKLGKKVVFETSFSELNDDWIRSARVQKKAEEGDEEAKQELERLKNTGTVILERTDDS